MDKLHSSRWKIIMTILSNDSKCFASVSGGSRFEAKNCKTFKGIIYALEIEDSWWSMLKAENMARRRSLVKAFFQKGLWPDQRLARPRDKIRMGLVLLVLLWISLLSALAFHSNSALARRGSTYDVSTDVSLPALPQEDDAAATSSRDEEERCEKSVHIFGDLPELRRWPELSRWYELLEQSPRVDNGVALGCRTERANCTVRVSLGTRMEYLRGKDAVIFGMLPRALANHIETLNTLAPEANQTWFFYSTESPHRTLFWAQNWNLTRLRFHKLMSYRWDSEVYIPFGTYKEKAIAVDAVNNSLSRPGNDTKKHLIAWVSSNCNGVSWPRKPFLSRIRARLPLHEYGSCGTKVCLPQHSEKCLHVFQKYRYLLILGNAECDDLIPADFWALALANNVVPVVYGVPKTDLLRVAPHNSFIHISDFWSTDDLADYLKFAVEDGNEYDKYLKWREKVEVKVTSPIPPKVVCQTLPHMFDGLPQYLRSVGESSWFNGCRDTPSKSSLTEFSLDRQYKAYNHWTTWRRV